METTWSEFNLDEARWEIPKERMKKPSPHIIPLARQVVETLKKLQKHHWKPEVCIPERLGWQQVHERRDHLGRFEAHGIRRDHDRPWIPWASIDRPARARLRGCSHRDAACALEEEQGQRSLRLREIPGAEEADDAGMGRFS